jgi:phage terminase small subunit
VKYEIEPVDLENPALIGLTAKQARFALVYVVTGSQRLAAKAAGYVGDDGQWQNGQLNGLRAHAWRTFHNPKVQAAIKALIGQRLIQVSPVALNALADIAADPKHKDRASVARYLLEVEGFSPTRRVAVEQSTTVHLSIEELRAKRDELLRRVTGRGPPMIDAEPAEDRT